LAPPELCATTTSLKATASQPSSPSSHGPTEPAPADAAHAIGGWRRFALWPLALLMKLWGRSLRFETAPEDLRAFTKND
jgi:hypothetical protein